MREQNKRTTSSGGVLDGDGGDVRDADGASLTCLLDDQTTSKLRSLLIPLVTVYPPHPERLPSHSLIRIRPGSRLECF